MKNKWKRVICTILALLMVFSTVAVSFVGCGKKEEEIVYELIPVTEEKLETGNYYVKNGESFYKLPDTIGRRSFDERNLIAKEATPDRTLIFGQDDVFIPTLYKDDMLIYVTNETIPNSFVWERYEDNGYTIGITGLKQNDAGRYASVKKEASIKADSTLGAVLADITAEETIVIDKVNGKSVNNTNVSKGGSITGLTYGTEYDVDAYVGSEYIEAKVMADAHAFTSFEIYETSTYNFAKSKYIILTIPEHFMSGYYLVNGAGFVKYADVTRETGNSGINFNAPYFLGVDEFGNKITADDPNAGVSTEIETEGNVYTQNFTLDCTNEKMTVRITYSDVFDKVNGVELNLSNAVVESLDSTKPTAVLKGPDGKEYTFVPSYEVENQMESIVQLPLSGTWTVEMKGFDLRTYDIACTLVSGHSDSMLHTGSGKANMNYYLNNSLENALFTVTWENTNRAATIEIKTPEGAKITKEENEDMFVEEGYGYVKVLIPNATYGDYSVTVDGDDLGRVRVSSLDLNATELAGTENALVNEQNEEVVDTTVNNEAE